MPAGIEDMWSFPAGYFKTAGGFVNFYTKKIVSLGRFESQRSSNCFWISIFWWIAKLEMKGKLQLLFCWKIIPTWRQKKAATFFRKAAFRLTKVELFENAKGWLKDTRFFLSNQVTLVIPNLPSIFFHKKNPRPDQQACIFLLDFSHPKVTLGGL